MSAGGPGIFVGVKSLQVRLQNKNRFDSKKDAGTSSTHRLRSVVTTIVSIVVPAYAAFLFGQLTENKKRIDENERTLFQQRMTLWVDTATEFEAFLANRKGLRKLAILERQNQKPPVYFMAMKTTYVNDRNSAHRKLVADLRKAQLFFSEKVQIEIRRLISLFEQNLNDPKCNNPKSE